MCEHSCRERVTASDQSVGHERQWRQYNHEGVDEHNHKAPFVYVSGELILELRGGGGLLMMRIYHLSLSAQSYK